MKEWEPKTSDCYLITGGQIKRLRDEQDPQKRNDIVAPLVDQKYHTELGDSIEKFDEQIKQKKLFEVI